MKPFASMKALFGRGEQTQTHRARLYREWDRQRSQALTPSDAAEIDAIFGRHL